MRFHKTLNHKFWLPQGRELSEFRFPPKPTPPQPGIKGLLTSFSGSEPVPLAARHKSLLMPLSTLTSPLSRQRLNGRFCSAHKKNGASAPFFPITNFQTTLYFKVSTAIIFPSTSFHSLPAAIKLMLGLSKSTYLDASIWHISASRE